MDCSSVRLDAATYPDEVARMVLVGARSEELRTLLHSSGGRPTSDSAHRCPSKRRLREARPRSRVEGDD